ncbi:hypothetical protein KB559_10770 [Paenibacillus sp. Marseille-P2973]|uniref:hypothetical protein n=1 Tax=Paenibacillus sp. Marseille-P2973 TaxID=1871032 RepID=UPI001B360C40|nr:hypothetical protein [Paenibacillus sp. Marseille-P2973]MBQ4899319.1 hypothetical protein [Paenibacillus sp. Marseille-P2973]
METKMTLEEEIRIVARNAARNLRTIRQNPENVSPDKLEKNIDYLKMMIQLHKTELKAQKNARRAGRTLSLRTRLKSLLVSILADSGKEGKEGTA